MSHPHQPAHQRPSPQNGRIALITGAGSGIGRAVAVHLAALGFHIVAAGRRLPQLEDTAELCARGGVRALAHTTDITDPASVDSLFQRVRTAFGRLDILFNNAGVGAPAVSFDELSPAQWKTVVDVNLTGAFLCAQAAFRLMKSQSPMGGRIINNGSISAHVPRPNSAPYTATKHAITGLTKSISLDGRPFQIACSQIDIGNAGTEMTARMATGVLQANGTMAPEPVMDVEHVAKAVGYMANLPLSANVQFITVMATAMPYIGRG